MKKGFSLALNDFLRWKGTFHQYLFVGNDLQRKICWRSKLNKIDWIDAWSLDGSEVFLGVAVLKPADLIFLVDAYFLSNCQLLGLFFKVWLADDGFIKGDEVESILVDDFKMELIVSFFVDELTYFVHIDDFIKIHFINMPMTWTWHELFGLGPSDRIYVKFQANLLILDTVVALQQVYDGYFQDLSI